MRAFAHALSSSSERITAVSMTQRDYRPVDLWEQRAVVVARQASCD
jgi:hypothetical protein